MNKVKLRNPTFKELVTNPNHLFAFGFGSGLAPKAPGTFGTLAAIPIYWLIQDLSVPIYLAWLLVTFCVGVYWCHQSSKALGVHDHSGIVWDEMVGYWLTMFLAPAGWLWIILGFVLFRIFDIIKPWPIGWLDRHVEGGLGIMVDDILAAIYALIILQALAYFFV